VKEWETINEGYYRGVLVVDEILQQFLELQFPQENAKGHTSAFTKSVIKAAELRVIEWLPFS
jgi:hypothetical protein